MWGHELVHYFLSFFIHFTDKQIIFEGEQNITLVARILPVANLTGFSCLYGSGLIVTVGGCGSGGERLYAGVDNMSDICCDREGPAAEVNTAETVCTG